MRILAIRGFNLASLAGEFEIDLQAEPLVSVGLFAISGETGAGKSSILDAMCLALFDKIPRLVGQSKGVLIGSSQEGEKSRVRQHDVRAIMRRGTGEARAEVDFKGHDSRIYRATWRLRRARKSPSGAFQTQDMQCLDVQSGRLLGSKKTEVQAIIVEKLGLTFEQFKRSVLLAQGDFASFLKSKADERSDLLERMTGSDLYSRVSKAAFLRSKQELDTLQAQAKALDYQAPLPNDERESLRQQQALQQATLSELQTQLHIIRQALSWYQQYQQIDQQMQQAKKLYELADTAYKKEQSLRDYLQQYEVAKPLFEQQANILKLGEDLENLTLSLDQKLLQLQDQQTKMAKLAQQKNTIAQQQVIHEQAWQSLQPELQQARAIDIQLEERQIAHHKQQASLQEMTLFLTQQEQTSIARQQALQTLQQEISTLTQWLNDHASDQLMANQWQSLQPQLLQYIEIERAYDPVRVSFEQKKQQQRETQATDLELKEALKNRVYVKQQAALTLKDAKALWQAVSTDRLKQDVLQVQRELVQQQKAGEWKQHELSLFNDGVELNRQIAQASQAQSTLQADIATLMMNIEQREPVLCSMQQAYESALLAENEFVENLRANLIENKPCPVCGSEIHPWQDILKPMSEHVERLNQTLQQGKNQQSEDLSQQAKNKGELKHLEQLVTGYQETLEIQTLDYQAHLEQGLGINLTAENVNLSELNSLISQSEQRLVDLNQQQAQADQRFAAYQQAQKTLDDQQILLQQVQEESNQWHEKTHQLDKLVGELQVELKQIFQQRESIVALLSAPLAPISNWQQKAADSLQQQIASRVQQYQNAEKQLLERQGEQQDLSQKQQLLAQDMASKQQQLRVLQQADSALKKDCDGLTQQRKNLLNGQVLDHLITQFNEKTDNMVIDFQRQETLYSDAQIHCVNTDKQLEAIRERCRLLTEQVNTKTVAWEQALIDSAMTAPALDLFAGQSADGLDEMKKRHKQRLDDQQTAYVRWQERESILREHQALHPQTAEADFLQQKLACDAQLEHVTDQLGQLNYQLQEDDQKRQQASVSLQKMQKQQAISDQWLAMSDLIGSSDGKKFRTFAQSLTLEILLEHANQHLKDLARRYRLQRVPNTDLELQIIDADMADEVRSVYSLSGGESFLVSLALALGLSSLTADITQVDSLFIDEGFASLDVQTLDEALSSLDNLQAKGRQIGIISHVPALVERIGAQVYVEKMGGGASRVSIIT